MATLYVSILNSKVAFRYHFAPGLLKILRRKVHTYLKKVEEGETKKVESRKNILRALQYEL